MDEVDPQTLEVNRPPELFQLCSVTDHGLKVQTRIKVRDGFWHLRRIDRVELSCVCIGYRPLYSFQAWDHSKSEHSAKRAEQMQRAWARKHGVSAATAAGEG